MGSEMCIRDRAVCFDDAVGQRKTPRHDDAVGEVVEVEDALSSGCLLYTSDAADDLLCVDLGGRRILKKKKPPRHHRSDTRSPDTVTLSTSTPTS